MASILRVLYANKSYSFIENFIHCRFALSFSPVEIIVKSY